jgi:release factor glutamine methyltransferase
MCSTAPCRAAPATAAAPPADRRPTGSPLRRDTGPVTVDRSSIRPALVRATRTLAEAGVASPRTDAELLAAHVLGIPRGGLLLIDAFTDPQRAVFEDLVSARASRVPLQHLTGSVSFGGIDVAVGPGAFVPRPETELLLAWALERPLPSAPVAVDFGSGTGAIALAIAHARPDARVFAVERDPAALEWLRRNASLRIGAGDHPIEVVAGDVTDPEVLGDLDGHVDLLLCNPPYVPDGTPVPAEVAEHDPAQAVFGGSDGLAVIRPVVSRAVSVLRTGGWVGIEHDESQDRAVAALLADAGAFADITVHADLAGRPRFTTARRFVHDADRTG